MTSQGSTDCWEYCNGNSPSWPHRGALIAESTVMGTHHHDLTGEHWLLRVLLWESTSQENTDCCEFCRGNSLSWHYRRALIAESTFMGIHHHDLTGEHWLLRVLPWEFTVMTAQWSTDCGYCCNVLLRHSHLLLMYDVPVWFSACYLIHVYKTSSPKYR